MFTGDLEMVVFFGLCIFLSIISIASKIYGYRLVLSMAAGIFWILFATQLTTPLFMGLFGLFGVIFIFFGIITLVNFR